MSDLTPDRGVSGDDRRSADDRAKSARTGRAVLPGEVVLPLDKDRSTTGHRGDGTAAEPGTANHGHTAPDPTAATGNTDVAGTTGTAGSAGTPGTAGAAAPTGAKPVPLSPETVTNARTGTSPGTGTGPGTGLGTGLGSPTGTGDRSEAGRTSASGTAVPPITAPTTGPSSSVERTAHAGTSGGHESAHNERASLFPDEECDRISARMRQAVVGFVDGPRDAVAEADEVLEELAARLTDVVDRRRRTLRGAWHQPEGGGKDKAASAATAVDTEQLRLALRDYRELTERLLHL
ncbi:hypothetical protein OG802_10510 [Streptomyces sp. NBC_00704]|uniref:hypothetical protein n=1 Tax=Streptomyces sp. NBC_00704 TaxID=2975809 RepID=UPI002E374A56|nr:hypothetical protein [Streptomyces sp. NBC_00704]